MKRILPWLLGTMLGFLLASALFGLLILVGILATPKSLTQFGYDIIAVSCAAPRGQSSPVIYQARVTARDDDRDGTLEVRATVYIGDALYSHPLGVIGTARDREEAVANFGEISWTDQELTIGGKAGIQATEKRSHIESHR